MRLVMKLVPLLVLFGTVVAQDQPKDKPALATGVSTWSELGVGSYKIAPVKGVDGKFKLSFIYTSSQTGYEVSASVADDKSGSSAWIVTIVEHAEEDMPYGDALNHHSLEVELTDLKGGSLYGVRFVRGDEEELVGVVLVVGEGTKDKPATGVVIGLFEPVFAKIKFDPVKGTPGDFELKFPVSVTSTDKEIVLEESKVDEEGRVIKLYVRDKTPADKNLEAAKCDIDLEATLTRLTKGRYFLDIYCAAAETEFIHAYRLSYMASAR